MEERRSKLLQPFSTSSKSSSYSIHDKPYSCQPLRTSEHTSLPPSPCATPDPGSFTKPFLQPTTKYIQYRSTQSISSEPKSLSEPSPNATTTQCSQRSQRTQQPLQTKLYKKGSKQKPTQTKQLTSRRTTQLRAKRLRRMVTLETRRALAQSDYHTKPFCLRNFGFMADPKKSLQQNFNAVIKTPHYHPQQQPSNLTFHNLCKLSTLPLNTKTLLGLNLKYCISGNNLNQNINKTLLQMAYSIRTKCHLHDIGYDGSADYEKQIYTKNKLWNPPPASIIIEDKLTEFGAALKAQQNKLIRKKLNKKFK
jgi:hypothetical protein